MDVLDEDDICEPDPIVVSTLVSVACPCPEPVACPRPDAISGHRLASMFGARDNFLISGLSIISNIQGVDKWGWFALNIADVRSSSHQASNIDAHTSLLYVKACSPLQQLHTALESSLQKWQWERVHATNFSGQGQLNTLSGEHYGWNDILVQTPLHQTLHQLCSAALRLCNRSDTLRKQAFHISFRTSNGAHLSSA